MHYRGRLVQQDSAVVHPRERQVECELVAVGHIEHWGVLEVADMWKRMQQQEPRAIREESSQIHVVLMGIRWLKTLNCDYTAMEEPYPSKVSWMPM
jgi:hypothetical protein